MATDPGESRALLSSDDIQHISLPEHEKTRYKSSYRLPWRAVYARLLGRRRFCRHAGRLGIVISIAVYSTLAILGVLIAFAFCAPSYTHFPAHYRELEERCSPRSQIPREGCANKNSEKVFIPISLYDGSGELAGGQWGQMLLELIELIGSENVFLSIYENDSGPGGRKGLATLKDQLRCRYSIVNDDHVSLDDFPTVPLLDGTRRVKRTVYLSEVRNRALRPLETFSAEELGTSRFDKILFLNDVLFNPIDAANLLFSTNQGVDGRAHYLAACAIDYYFDPFQFYDSYALRDAEGFRSGEQIFPIFSGAGDAISRSAMLNQLDAVPVKSCWSGMVAMQAKYVQENSTVLANPATSPSNTTSSPPQSQILSTSLDNDDPRPIAAPVRFRGEPEPYLDACECCLFLADVTHTAIADHARETSVFINPFVRVAYSPRLLSLIPWARRWERMLIYPQRILTWKKHKPVHNPHLAVSPGDDFVEEVWSPDAGGSGSGGWSAVRRKGRSGLFCGVRSMQVMRPRADDREGSSWEKVPLPPGQTLFEDAYKFDN